MPTIESAKFEEKMRKILESKFSVKFIVNKKVNLQGVPKKLDYVSEKETCIGDAKYYCMCPNGNTPSAKLSTISEYVWLLEKTKAKHKFIVFGQDIEVPRYWLDRYGKLTNVKFYFYDDESGLKELN